MSYPVLAYWPRAVANPFHSLLYNQSWRYGWTCVPCLEIADLANLRSGARTVCHFHWLKSIDNSKEGFRGLLNLLRQLKSQEKRVVWTIHNVLPHDQANVEGAVRIRKLMVEAADVIHIMNKDTAELVEPYFSIRDKPTFYSPHPSYLGAYPNTVTKQEARFQLGLRPNATVFLCFGAIQPYKGFEDVIAAIQALAMDDPGRDWQLVIAGAATNADLVERLTSIDTLPDRLLVRARTIPTVEVEYYLNSADYCVLPYRQSLNSGTAHLAMSFGVPVVAPAISAFGEIFGHFAGISYQPGDMAALATALATAIGADHATMKRNAMALAEARRAGEPPPISSTELLASV